MRYGEASGRLSNDDVARLSEQIAGLTSAGLPLSAGLRAAAEEMPRGRLRTTLGAIAESLDQGASMKEAVAQQGQRLPPHLRGLVLAGARTGKTSQVLGRFVAFMNVGADLRRRLWLNLAYPAVSLVVSLAVFTFVCSSLIGSFSTIFKDFGVPLPKITILILSVARLFDLSWPVFFEMVIGTVVLFAVGRLALNASTRRSLLAGVPVVGAVWRNSSLAEFSHLLALLLECEVPLPEALQLTGDGVQDDMVGRACALMAKDVEQGLSLAQAVTRQKLFPRGLARVMTWAEGHQSLPESLRMIGEMFEARARAQSGFAGAVIGVVAVIAILFGVALIVVGLFLPLITLITRLSG